MFINTPCGTDKDQGGVQISPMLLEEFFVILSSHLLILLIEWGLGIFHSGRHLILRATRGYENNLGRARDVSPGFLLPTTLSKILVVLSSFGNLAEVQSQRKEHDPVATHGSHLDLGVWAGLCGPSGSWGSLVLMAGCSVG